MHDGHGQPNRVHLFQRVSPNPGSKDHISGEFCIYLVWVYYHSSAFFNKGIHSHGIVVLVMMVK